MRYATWVRPSVVVLALALLLASPAPRAAAAPEGQMTWAVHVSIAPAWFDPGEHPGIITSMLVFYALHDALLKPMPGNPTAPSLAESWTVSPDGLAYEFVLRRGVVFHNGETMTAEDVKFSFERYRGAAAKLFKEKVAAVEVVDPLRVRIRLREPWPDFMAFFATPATGAALDRAQGLRGEGRRGRVQEGPDRRRPLQVRLLQPRRGDGARGARALLAQAAQRQAARLPRGHRRRRRGLPCSSAARWTWPIRSAASWPRSQAHAGAQACAHPDTRDVLGRLHQRAMEPEVAVARSSACAWPPASPSTGRPSARPRRWASPRSPSSIIPSTYEFYWPAPPIGYDPAQAKRLLAEAGFPQGFDAGELTCDCLLQQRGRGRGQLLQCGGHQDAAQAAGAGCLAQPMAGEEDPRPHAGRRRAPSATPPPASTTT